MAARWQEKNWDKIAQDLDDGVESDDGDTLNVMSVQRNARRVAELMHTVLPGGLEPAEMGAVAPPMGSNRADHLKFGAHAREAIAASLPAVARPASGEVASSSESKKGA